MPKTLYTSVQGLEPFGGVKPVGVQVRVKGGTGPFVPRFIEDDEGVILLLECKRGDLTLKHLEDNPVIRIDLDATEILEVTDKDAAYELIRRMRSERDRAISVASGYDGTFDEAGQAVHTDADGTILTAAEVAARRGLTAGPSLEEADAWWGEQQYFPGADYPDVGETEILDLLLEQGPTLSEVEYVGVLEQTLAMPRPAVLEVVAHYQPGPSPLEDGLPIDEVRARLESLTSRTVLEDLIETERVGKGRRRVLTALGVRLERLGEAPAPDAPAVDEDPFE